MERGLIIVRAATLLDVPQMVEVGGQAHAESPVYARLPFDPVRAGATASGLIAHPDGLALVAVQAGAIVGGTLATVAEHWSGGRYCHELITVVRPDRRGARIGLRLLRALIEWARGTGAPLLVAGVSSGIAPERAARLYELAGMRRIGAMMEVNL